MRIDLFTDYENSKLVTVEEYARTHYTVPYSKLPTDDKANGIPIAIRRDEKGELQITFAENSHCLCIGATRSGKTTGFVIPALNVFLTRKNKPSLVISDPKRELYTQNASRFEAAGYRVLLLDFIDSTYSDAWNPLTKFFRLYREMLSIEKNVYVAQGVHIFRGRKYHNLAELQKDLKAEQAVYADKLDRGINALAESIFLSSVSKNQDPFWVNSARHLFKAVVYGMLEDSEDGGITEDNFSLSTVISIVDSFSAAKGGLKRKSYDNGYFSDRDHSSTAFLLANKCILEQADTTRSCIVSEFMSLMNKFRDTSVKHVTSTNTFEMAEIDDDKPTVIFVAYKDEESSGYELISMFLSSLYSELISISRKKEGKLSRPFYFLLDEFGNLPPFANFDKIISACGGRNIWFLLILQSYAQLNSVYGSDTAEIIKDNLNVHVFFGTNNPQTKSAFSDECGKQTVISPLSALNGEGEHITRFDKDTVPLVPISSLSKIAVGEAYVTQMREDVLLSYFERSYTCPEFEGERELVAARGEKVFFADPKYAFKLNSSSADEDGEDDDDIFDF